MTKTGIPPSHEMTVIDHLEELRSRLLKSVGFLLITTLTGFVFAKPLVAVLKLPSHHVVDHFILVKPTEIIAVYFKIALYVGFLLALPYILFQLWRFIKPALEKRPSLHLVVWGLAAVLLFAGGTAFVFFFAAPEALNFLMRLSKDSALPMLTLNFYTSFILSLLVLGGFIFEIPVVTGLLTSIGLLNPRILRQNRKIVVFVLFIIAAVMTPTTDVFNMLLFALPMIVLFEIAILLSSLIFKAKLKKDPVGEAYETEH